MPLRLKVKTISSTIQNLGRGSLVLCTITVASAPAHATAAASEALYEQLSRQVVLIETKDRFGRPLGQGSGLVLGPSLGQVDTGSFDARYSNANSNGVDILSNFHVIAFAGEINVQTKNGAKILAAVVYGDSDRDVAILRTVRALFDARPVSFAGSFKVGQKVYALGSPKGLGWTFSDGIISGLRNNKESRFIQTTAPISPGSSGGGLFNEQGALIGMTTLQMVEGQNLNFALELVSASTELRRLRRGNCVRPVGVGEDEWIVGVIKRAPDLDGSWRDRDPKWREWEKCNAAIKACRTDRPETEKMFTAAWDRWAAEERTVMAHRFSRFSSDIDGLVAALKLAKDGKARDELIKAASNSATGDLRFQRHLLNELSYRRDTASQFLELFEEVVDSLATKPADMLLLPVELSVEIGNTVRDFRGLVRVLKSLASSPQRDKVIKIEETLRRKGWLSD